MSEAIPLPRAAGPDLAIDGASFARSAEAPVDPLFLERRSTRVFDGRAVPPEILRTLFEAARWAPSSRNEQPWRFVFAASPEAHAELLGGLVEMNQRWAAHAPVLAYLFVRPTTGDGQPNPFAEFDAGAAWMALALQAHLLGLSAHAMGGVDRSRMSEISGLDPLEYRPVAAIAIGYPAAPDRVPAVMQESERPTPRRPLREVATEQVRHPLRTPATT